MKFGGQHQHIETKKGIQMKSIYQVQHIYTDLLQSPIEMVQIDNDSN